MSDTGKELLRVAEHYCSHGDTVFNNSPPRMFSRCSESFLFDEEGHVYFDMQMQNASANFGYQNQQYRTAIIDQLDQLPQLASEYLSHERVALCRKVAESIKIRWGETGRVHLNVGGAQAIDDALKLVAVNTGSRRVFAFEGSYHGRTIGASAITSSFRYRAAYGDFDSRALFIPFPYCYRCPYAKKRADCGLFCLTQLERLFETEFHSILDPLSGRKEFGAFFVEPIQGRGGYVIPPTGYMEGLDRILKTNGILLVSDEIQMGFFRTGKLWSMENFGAKPDIITFGKALTNGLNPLSGLWACERLISPEKFPPGSAHSTFSGNPLGCRLGLTTFAISEATDIGESVSLLGAYFLEGLQYLKQNHAVIGDVDGIGLALRVELCKANSSRPDPQLAKSVRSIALNTDVPTDVGSMRMILNVGGYYNNVITLSPSLNITKDDINRSVAMIDQYIRMASIN